MMKLAAIQSSLSDKVSENVEKVENFVAEAARAGAKIILPSELFEGHYFCKEEKEDFFARAHAVDGHPFLGRFQKLAGKLKQSFPSSFFERAGQAHYNSVAVMDADGSLLGIYRKSHIPDGPGYEEKYYFKSRETQVSKSGKLATGMSVWVFAGINGTRNAHAPWRSWGQTFCCYPTAIGNEPGQKDLLLTKDRWQRAMIGHAVSNVMPVVAANRIGWEGEQFFYGHSFITNTSGDKVVEFDEKNEGVLYAETDFAANKATRAAWGFFRDRRPELYKNY